MRPILRRAAGMTGALLLAAGTVAQGQGYVGGTKCFGCHKLGKKAWQDSHAQTLAQLSEPRAAEYAKATGGDAKHPKCLACHAPVPLAAGPAAVSCETCHGPAKGWLAPHQEPEFYAQPPAQWKGLRNLHKNAREIARLCVECHVLNDKSIAAAGHPVGGAFDAGRDMGSPKMVHWPSGTVDDTRVRAYDKAFYATITREGAPIVASRAAGSGGGKAVAASSAAKPSVTAGGAATRPGGAGGRPSAATSGGRSTPLPNDEYADLGDDEFVASPAGAAVPSSSRAVAPPPPKVRPIERLALPDAPAGAFDKAPVRVAPRATPPPPPAVSARTPAAAAPAAPRTTSPAAPRATPPASLPARARGAAESRGRAALVLADLIRQKKKLDLPKPAPPAEFAGPDGELLRLQDEVLALALETLRRDP